MSEIAEKDITPDAGTTLRKVLKLELEPFLEQFDVISGAATKVIIIISSSSSSSTGSSSRLVVVFIEGL